MGTPAYAYASGCGRLRKRPLGRYRYVRLRWRVLFAVIDFVGAIVFGAFRVVRRSRPHGQHDTGEPKRILLVQLDHLGDAIITTAMLPALRRRFPDASIEVLAGAWNREVFEAAPEVDCVHVSRVNRFARAGLRRTGWSAAVFWWGWKLRRLGIDLGIDVRGEFPLALMLWLAGVRRRVGWGAGGGAFLLTDTAEFVPDRPEVESRMALLAQVGIRGQGSGVRGQGSGAIAGEEMPLECDDKSSHSKELQPSPSLDDGVVPRPRFRLGDRAREEVGRRLAELAARDPVVGPLVVLHVGAGSRAKQWPATHWQELLGRIIVEHGARIVLVGGGSDRAIARQILAGRPWPGVWDWTGRLTVVRLAALLERADVAVGADSGPAHLAAAVGTPVVVLFSGTNNAKQWQPRGEQVTVVRRQVRCSPCHRERCPISGHPCMRGLLPEQVAAEVTRTLCTSAAGSAAGFQVSQAGCLPHLGPDLHREGTRP